MRSYIAVVGMAAAVAAQTSGFIAINLPGTDEAVPACTTYNIQWTPSTDASMDGEVTFNLIGGATQQTLSPIGDTFGSVLGSAGTYAWDVPCDAGAEAVYGLTIFLVSDTTIFQYSMPFQITPVDGGDSTAESPTETAGPIETEGPYEIDCLTEFEGPTETDKPMRFPGFNSTDTMEPPHMPSGTMKPHMPGDFPSPSGTMKPYMPTGSPTGIMKPHMPPGSPNGTIPTHMSIATSYTGSETVPTETNLVQTAGAFRSVTAGSFAVLAAAAAFFAL